MELQVASRVSGDVTIVDVQGRVTIGAATNLLNAKLQQVIEGGARKLVLNLAGTTQVDSSGLCAVVRAFVALQRGGGSLKLLRPVGRVREALEITHLLTVIPAYDDEAQALASFRVAGKGHASP